MVKQTVFFRFGPAKPQKCDINLLNQQYWYEFPALFRTNKWLFRLALAILALLKSAKKSQKQRKTAAKAVVFVVDDIGLELHFLPVGGREKMLAGWLRGPISTPILLQKIRIETFYKPIDLIGILIYTG